MIKCMILFFYLRYSLQISTLPSYGADQFTASQLISYNDITIICSVQFMTFLLLMFKCLAIKLPWFGI